MPFSCRACDEPVLEAKTRERFLTVTQKPEAPFAPTEYCLQSEPFIKSQALHFEDLKLKSFTCDPRESILLHSALFRGPLPWFGEERGEKRH